MRTRAARLPGTRAEVDDGLEAQVIHALQADLAAGGEGLRCIDLAQRMQLHKSTLGRLLRGLEASGTIERAEGQRWRYSSSGA